MFSSCSSSKGKTETTAAFFKEPEVEHHQAHSLDFPGLDNLRAGGLKWALTLGPSCSTDLTLRQHELLGCASLGWPQAGHQRLLVSQVLSTLSWLPLTVLINQQEAEEDGEQCCLATQGLPRGSTLLP